MVAVVGGVVATLVSGLLTATPASAAAGPVITSISVSTNAVKAPGEVVLSYTATTTAPVDEALAGYKDPAGRLYSVNLSKGTSGSGTRKVPDGVQNGTWTLQYVFLTYSPNDFTYACNPSYASTNAKCTETRDLSPYDVVVSGSTEDFDAPVLRSVSVTPTTAAPSAPLTVSFRADDVLGVADVKATWKHRTRADWVTTQFSGRNGLADGEYTQNLPATIYNGEYDLQSLVLKDPNGFRSTYASDGSVTYQASPGIFFPQPVRPPGTHTIDFSAATFHLTGSTVDGDAPVITSLALQRPSPSAKDPTGLRFTATDRQGGVSFMNSTWAVEPGGGSTGPLAAFDLALNDVLPLPGTPGATYRLSTIRIKDRQGNLATYSRDGVVLLADGTTTTHALNFPSLDFTLRPSAPRVQARSRPQSAKLSVTSFGSGAGVTGYRVVVSPGGKVLNLSAPDATGLAEAQVNGLTNGIPYTIAVTPQSNVGPGPTTTVSVTPMISGNVWGAGDVNIDRRDDLFARLPAGQVRLYRGAGFPKFKAATTVTDLPSSRNFPSGRIYGYTAFLTINQNGGLEGNMVDRDGKSLGSTISGTGWGSMRSIDGSADFSGDGLPDIVAVTSTGAMRLYKGNGQGRFAAGTQIGTGWGSMVRVFVPGDVTGDRRADVMAVDATGVLWIYRGNGKGALTSRVKVGSGWGGLGALFSARDANGDSRGDLGAITMNGELRFYKGRGNGTFTGATVAGTGWGSFL
ncbi:hypothetical protein ASC58_18245 [Phycicoccus sp. Root101]|nr:hypothetical protein ASC58_18245 [Phycicoccus sp. Root101]